MKREQQKQLEALLSQKIEIVAGKVLANDAPADVKASLEELDSLSKLLTMGRKNFAPEWIIGLTVGVICLGIVSLLWNMKVPASPISLTVTTDVVRGKFAEDWQVQSPFQTSGIVLQNLASIEAPNLDLEFLGKTDDAWFQIVLEEGILDIAYLKVSQNSFMQMESRVDQLDLLISGAPMEGRLTVTGKGTLTAGGVPGVESQQIPFDILIPETITFTASNSGIVPARLVADKPLPWKSAAIPFEEIGFSIEELRNNTEITVVSGITSGSFRFNNTGWETIAIREQEIVSVHGTSSARVTLEDSSPGFEVSINGEVRDVTFGDARGIQTISPSYLEVLYNEKSLALFWGAMAFGWGLLWSVRKTVFP
jgi:hypothetical protein